MRPYERALKLVCRTMFVFYWLIRTRQLCYNIPKRPTDTCNRNFKLGPNIRKEVFGMTEPLYNFQSEAKHFNRGNIRTSYYGIQSVGYLGPKIWQLVSNSIKNCNSPNNFKKLVTSWKPNVYT